MLLAKITDPQGHYDVRLDDDSLTRLIVWMDGYAQKLGSFGPDQERRLLALRQACAHLLIGRPPGRNDVSVSLPSTNTRR